MKGIVVLPKIPQRFEALHSHAFRVARTHACLDTSFAMLLIIIAAAEHVRVIHTLSTYCMSMS